MCLQDQPKAYWVPYCSRITCSTGRVLQANSSSFTAVNDACDALKRQSLLYNAIFNITWLQFSTLSALIAFPARIYGTEKHPDIGRMR